MCNISLSLTLIFSGDGEFVISVIIVRVELLVIANETAGIHAKVIVGYEIFYFRVRARVGVGCFNSQYICPRRDILVDIVSLIIWQLELRSVIVNVRYANR